MTITLRILPVVIFFGCGYTIWMSECLVINAINVLDDGLSFAHNSKAIFECTIDPYTGSQAWRVDSVTVADCGFAICSVNVSNPARYSFSPNRSTGNFIFTIEPVLKEDNGNVIECFDGSNTVNYNLIVTDIDKDEKCIRCYRKWCWAEYQCILLFISNIVVVAALGLCCYCKVVKSKWCTDRCCGDLFHLRDPKDHSGDIRLAHTKDKDITGSTANKIHGVVHSKPKTDPRVESMIKIMEDILQRLNQEDLPLVVGLAHTVVTDRTDLKNKLNDLHEKIRNIPSSYLEADTRKKLEGVMQPVQNMFGKEFDESSDNSSENSASDEDLAYTSANMSVNCQKALVELRKTIIATIRMMKNI